MNKKIIFMVLTACTLMLSACGQTGPLFLPTNTDTPARSA